MKLGNRGIALITEFEGLVLKAYQDVVGVWTIGYGHTGLDVHPGQEITHGRALDFLLADAAKCETTVNAVVKVTLKQNQFDALVSFIFNVGVTAFGGSTLLKRLNAGDFSGAAAQFGRWNKAGGRVVKGLTRRRAAERALFEAT